MQCIINLFLLNVYTNWSASCKIDDAFIVRLFGISNIGYCTWWRMQGWRNWVHQGAIGTFKTLGMICHLQKIYMKNCSKLSYHGTPRYLQLVPGLVCYVLHARRLKQCSGRRQAACMYRAAVNMRPEGAGDMEDVRWQGSAVVSKSPFLLLQ